MVSNAADDCRNLNLSRLETTSRRLAICFTVFAAATLVMPVVTALAVGRSHIMVDDDWVKSLPQEISPLLRIALAVAGVILAIPAAVACKRVRDLFRLYADGQFFTMPNIECLRSIARALVWTGASMSLGGAVMHMVAALPKREIEITLGIRGTDLLVFAVAGVVYAIAHVMELARDADQERAQFV